MKRIHELRGHDPDDAAMPAVAGDNRIERADVRIGLDNFFRDSDDTASSSCR